MKFSELFILDLWARLIPRVLNAWASYQVFTAIILSYCSIKFKANIILRKFIASISDSDDERCGPSITFF